MNPRPTLCGLLSIALTSASLCAGDAHTTPAEVLLKVGDPIPGYDAAANGSSSEVRVRMGPGGWAIRVTSDGEQYTLTESGQSHSSRDMLPGGDSIDELGSMDVGPDGQLAQLAELTDGWDAVLINGEVALHGGALVDVPGLTPGKSWSRFEAVSFDAAGRLTISARLLPEAPPLVLQSVYVRYAVDAAGQLSQPELLLSELSTVAGMSIAGLTAHNDVNFGVTDAGEVAVSVLLLTDDPIPEELRALVLGDEILILEGTESVVPGRDWKVGAEGISVNGQGDVAFKTRVEGAGVHGTSGISVLMKNDDLLAMEGQPVPGFPGSQLLFVTEPRISEAGNVAWGAFFRDAFGNTLSGYYVDSELMVLDDSAGAAQATLIEGLPLTNVDLSERDWDLSEDGGQLLLNGEQPGSVAPWAIVSIDTKPWTSLGGGLAGAAAEAPLLVGTGDLNPGELFGLELSGAPSLASTWLVIGLSELAAPFKGGTLCPAPDIVVGGLVTDGAGELVIGGAFPVGIPAGGGIWHQLWFVDGAGPLGFSATNCLRATTP